MSFLTQFKGQDADLHLYGFFDLRLSHQSFFILQELMYDLRHDHQLFFLRHMVQK